MTIPRPLSVVGLCVPWIVVTVALAWLFVVRYPASGVFTVDSQLDGRSAWINPFLPAERTTSPGRQADGWIGQRLLGDPAYMTARVPGPYDRVDVELEYRPIRQPLLEFGLVHDAEGKQLELQPLYAEQIDPNTWEKTQTGYAHGVASRPSSIATWDATATMPLLADASATETTTPVSLRGSHDFYLVPAGGSVRMTFTLQAANRTTGSDIAAFRVFRGSEEIQREAFGANGSRERRMDQKIEHEVLIPHADPGVYRISLVTSDDVFVREIRTTSRHWVVGPRLYFGDTVGYATTTSPGVAWTDSQHLVAETLHHEGLQTMSFASVQRRIIKTHEAIRLDRTDDATGPVSVRAPQGDVRIVGDGLFALRQDAWFTAVPHRLTDATDVAREHIDAIITPYVQPERLDDGWLRSSFTFSINPTLDRLRFTMSAPGISSRTGAVDIRRMRLTYHRPSQNLSDWFHAIRQELANAWHRL